MVVINAPVGIYSNLYSLTGYPVGTHLTITNCSSGDIFLFIGDVQPSANSFNFPALPNESVNVNGTTQQLWIRGESNGPVVVQKFTQQILNARAVDPGVYVGVEAFTTQSFVEANCKNGTQYEISTYDANFVNGTNRDFVVITGSKPILIKNRVFQFTGSQLTVNIYRNPTYTGGTPLTYYNMSTINPVVGLAQILGAPTVSAVGTQIAPTTVLLGNVPQTGQAIVTTNDESSVRGLERVLAPNSVFLFRTTNSSPIAMALSSKNTWYEGDLSSTIF